MLTQVAPFAKHWIGVLCQYKFFRSQNTPYARKYKPSFWCNEHCLRLLVRFRIPIQHNKCQLDRQIQSRRYPQWGIPMVDRLDLTIQHHGSRVGEEEILHVHRLEEEPRRQSILRGAQGCWVIDWASFSCDISQSCYFYWQWENLLMGKNMQRRENHLIFIYYEDVF